MSDRLPSFAMTIPHHVACSRPGRSKFLAVIALYCLSVIGACAGIGWTATPRAEFIVGFPTGASSVLLPADSRWPIEFEKPDSVYLRVPVDGDDRIVVVPFTIDGLGTGRVEGVFFRTSHDLRVDAGRQFVVFKPRQALEVLQRVGGDVDLKLPATSPVAECRLPASYFELTASIRTAPKETTSEPAIAQGVDDLTALRSAHACDSVEIATEAEDFVCLIEGMEGAGTGFLMRDGDNVYCYTCFHVIDGMQNPSIRLLNGTRLVPLSLEVAQDRDVARMLVANCPPALVGYRAAEMGEDVKVYGNSQGAGRVTLIEGEVTGLGENEVETDAGFTVGNSGSALIAKADDRVVGVASYLEQLADAEDFTVRGTRFTTPRRVGETLDDDVQWTVVDFERFYSANRKFHEYSDFLSQSIDLLGRIQYSPNLPISNSGIRDVGLRRWIAHRNRRVQELGAGANPNSIRTQRDLDAFVGKFMHEYANQHAYFQRMCRLRESQIRSLRTYPGTEFQEELVARLLAQYEAMDMLNDLIFNALQSSAENYAR